MGISLVNDIAMNQVPLKNNGSNLIGGGGTGALVVSKGASGLGASVVTVPTQPKSAHVVNQIAPGLPVVGVKVKPTQVDVGPAFEVPDINGIAAAGVLEVDLGLVYDIVDYSGTALAYGKVAVVTPDGRYCDLHILTRTKAQDRWIPSMAAGKWQLINISGAALTGVTIAFWHVDEK